MGPLEAVVGPMRHSMLRWIGPAGKPDRLKPIVKELSRHKTPLFSRNHGCRASNDKLPGPFSKGNHCKTPPGGRSMADPAGLPLTLYLKPKRRKPTP